MRLSLRPLEQLERLSEALTDSGDDLQSILLVLLDDLRAAVPSFTGLELTIMVGAEHVRITAADCTAATASMALPLHLISGLPDPGELVFYAAEPDAFRDVAAAARAAYDLNGQVQLDGHLPPRWGGGDAAVMVEGPADQSMINQALGVLMEQGYPPEQAKAELAARAAASGVSPLQIAYEVLDGLDQSSAGERPAALTR